MKKITQNYIEEFFKQNNCKLLDIYISAQKKTRFICSCGNISTTCWMSFRKGHRCRKCGIKKFSSKLRLQLCDIERFFEKYNCHLISKIYKNVNSKLDYICSCGNKHSISFAHFKNGQRCTKCRYRKLAGKTSGKNHWKYIKDREITKENLILANRCRSLVRRCYKVLNMSKVKHTYDILGYNTEDLIKYIHSHPNWSNCKDKKWHLDHFYPIKSFIDYNIKDIKLINCLENLQPLSQIDNTSKGDRYNKQEFENWLKKKGVKFESKL